MDTQSREHVTVRRDLLALLAFAAAVRLFMLLGMPRVIDTADAIHYLEVAKRFASGDFLHINAKIPLLYPALTALVGLVVGDMERAGTLVSFVASCLLVLPLYALAFRLHGRDAARVACVVVGLSSWFADYACRIGPDALACTLWITGVYALERAVRGGGGWMLVAPLVYFFLMLSRAEGLFLMGAAVVGTVILCPDRDLRPLKRLLPFAVIVAVLLGVYALYMRKITGNAAVTTRVADLYWNFGIRHFVLFASTFQKTLCEVLPIMLGPVLFLFLGVGLFTPDPEKRATRDLRFELFVLFVAGMQWAMSLTVLSPEPRYQMSVIVVLTIWSARGLLLVSRQAATLKHGRVLRTLPLAALLLLLAYGVLGSVGAEYMSRRPREPREYKVVGLWMKDNLSPSIIFTRKPQIGYYAEMPSTGPAPDDTLQGAIARARAAGAKYLVVDERYTASMTPALAPLLDPAMAPPELKLLKAFEPFPECTVVVYELLPAAGS